ncbi:unnamed protein product [Symbiodinium necroappetens]|uniref:Uncharacterized protein n=1 Tax=Symbiodinium necroappetens TaxID=1628268 RepID=A0A812N131_9DINO|nr:unnamed protein product [Symbiodinium necroappetens]
MWRGFAMWSLGAWCMLGRVLSQSVQSSPDTSCMLQFSAAHQNLDSSDPDCSSSADWTEQLRVTALNSTSSSLSGISTSSGAEGDTSLMAWSPNSGTVPGDVLVFKYSASAGWEVQANLTEVASQNVTLPASWADDTALSSEKIVVASERVNVAGVRETHTFKYDGASWVFLGQQSFPSINSLLFALGGDLLVFEGAQASNRVFQTFQLQGSSWSLVPTAEIQLVSSEIPRFASDGRTLAIQLESQVFVYRWAANSWSNVANISEPTGFGLGPVDVDGDYIIASWVIVTDTFRLETAIYEDQSGLWSEVFRIENDPSGVPFTRVLEISSSGKAIVDCASAVGCSGITILEVSSNGTWGVTQTIDYVPSASRAFPSGAISAISLAVAQWVVPAAGPRESIGRIFGCNGTSPTSTTTMPLPYYRPYYGRRCPPRCRRHYHRPPWFWWRCKRLCGNW